MWAREGKGAKISRKGNFTPFKQPAGRSLFEARGIFRPLRRSARALPLTHELLKKFDQNFPLFCFLLKIENFRLCGNSP
jgi:hypothetical protein